MKWNLRYMLEKEDEIALIDADWFCVGCEFMLEGF